jgi:hypothetical protein
MRADRIFPKLASLGAMLALCLAVAAPARATLFWGAPVPNPATSTTSLDLISSAELTGVGFDYFIVALSFPPDEQLLSAITGEALPPWPQFNPGWKVSEVLHDSVQVDYVGAGDLQGILPAGQLLTFTFAGLDKPQVAGSVIFYGITDGEIDRKPIVARAPIPEPSSWLLMAAGLVGLGLAVMRRHT